MKSKFITSLMAALICVLMVFSANDSILVALAESTGEVIMTEVESTELAVESGKAAEYSADVTYKADGTVKLTVGETEIFVLQNKAMTVLGSGVSGEYGAGTYKLYIYFSPAQQMVRVEITLPNGGSIVRGVAVIPEGSAFVWTASSEDAISNASVKYVDVTLDDYVLNTTEPSAKDEFSKSVYNIVNSFDDPKTTRLFAWTAVASFLGADETMVIKYRVKGNRKWQQADAVKQKESIAEEDYFKVDLKGLSAGTEYEYCIGVKDSDDADRWSNVYTFTTTAKNTKDFQFVIIGDTQGVTWEGNTVENKGYVYAQAAIEKAIAEAGQVDFIMHTGDVTESAINLKMWNWYFKTLGDYSAKIPQFVAIGNHDTWVDGSLDNPFNLHFNHPDNGSDAVDMSFLDGVTNKNIMVQFTKSEETVYSYDYGDIHFIVLNSGAYSKQDEPLIQAQREWLINDLENNKDARWTVVMVHQPVYHRYGTNSSRPWLYNVIEEYGVDLVIQGHSHIVTRTYPMKNGEIVTKVVGNEITQGVGTIYTTIGSTAVNHDKIGELTSEECMLAITTNQEQPAYTIVKVEGYKLTMTIKQLDGCVLDQFSIVATKPARVEEDTDDSSFPIGWAAGIGGGLIVAAAVVAFIVIKKKKVSAN